MNRHKDKVADSKCLQPKPVKRRTAGKLIKRLGKNYVILKEICLPIAIQSSSFLKISFDIQQLSRISQYMETDTAKIQDVSLRAISKFLVEKGWDHYYVS